MGRSGYWYCNNHPAVAHHCSTARLGHLPDFFSDVTHFSTSKPTLMIPTTAEPFSCGPQQVYILDMVTLIS